MWPKFVFSFIFGVAICIQIKSECNTTIYREPLITEVLPKDTIIDIPVYINEISEIRELIDTTLSINPYYTSVFERSDQPGYSDYYVIKPQRLTINKIHQIRGILQYNSSDKSLYLLGLSDTELLDYGFVKTDSVAHISCYLSNSGKVGTVSLGIKAYIKRYENGSLSIKLSYNNYDISDSPDIAAHYSFINPKWDYDSIKGTEKYSSLQKMKRIYKTARAKKFCQPLSSVYINNTADTLRTNLNYFAKSETIDRFITIPIYRFDNTFAGRLTDRICNTIAANDIFNQLCIRPNPDYKINKGIIITEDAKRWHDLPELLKGVVFVDNNNYPVFLFNLSPDYLKEYGLVKTEQILTIHLVADWVGILPDTVTGYYVTMRKDNNDEFNIQLYFNQQALLDDEAQPFRWIIDEYINNTNN